MLLWADLYHFGIVHFKISFKFVILKCHVPSYTEVLTSCYQEEKIHVNTYAGQVPLYQETEDIVVI